MLTVYCTQNTESIYSAFSTFNLQSDTNSFAWPAKAPEDFFRTSLAAEPRTEKARGALTQEEKPYDLPTIDSIISLPINRR